MCRLFGLHAGTKPADATFWLLDAPDSLSSQSHRNQDGFGIGTWSPSGEAVVDKAPRPAWSDSDFATAAHDLTGTTFVAHVRHATAGGLTDENTHPFLQQGRLFAHNGALGGGDLATLDAHLRSLSVGGRPALDLVLGQTDSERYFALVTASIEARGGDVEAGVADAVAWMTGRLPVVSLNFVLTTPTDVWALRLPATDTLYVLERPAGGESGGALRVRGSQLAAGSAALADRASLVVASEPLDGEPGWRGLEPGELVHVGPSLAVESTRLPSAS
ncbi:class II glutamine amidotransferase [Frondihabitans australicus]|uniref:Glutamine amidotransferase n=1 Tax=Frondihabitans australicus TaxID=386892 RepID=A0A495IC73_9MICO|nr:class II glutamine amidotransferase [Frondihabitans australicus]RKR73522.1 glutamine amidotransferase [Frondihabitans australicus]